MIIGIPDVFRPGTVSAQPQHALDSSQIEAFREIIVIRKVLRRDREGAVWSLVFPNGLFPTFRLIRILQSQMGPQLKRTETQTELFRSFVDLDDGGALSEAQMADGRFEGCDGILRFSSGEKVTKVSPRRRSFRWRSSRAFQGVRTS